MKNINYRGHKRRRVTCPQLKYRHNITKVNKNIRRNRVSRHQTTRNKKNYIFIFKVRILFIIVFWMIKKLLTLL